MSVASSASRRSRHHCEPAKRGEAIHSCFEQKPKTKNGAREEGQAAFLKFPDFCKTQKTTNEDCTDGHYDTTTNYTSIYDHVAQTIVGQYTINRKCRNDDSNIGGFKDVQPHGLRSTHNSIAVVTNNQSRFSGYASPCPPQKTTCY